MWHNGRQPQASEYYRKKMQEKALNERLTGKLVAALRLVLDKS